MDIVEEIRNDREKGARLLESEYKAGLLTLASRLCNDPSDAEELVNRTFAAVLEGIDGFLEQSAFFTWMCRILVRCHAKDERRASRRNESAAPETVEAAADEGAADRILREVDASLLRDAVKALPPDIRRTVVMHYFLDVPVREVARVMAIPVGTIAWRLHYARMLLAAKLGATRSQGARLVLLGLLLAAGLAVAIGVASRFSAESSESRAESAEIIDSHAENSENAESESPAESAACGWGSAAAETSPVELGTFNPLNRELSNQSTITTVKTMKPSFLLLSSAASLALAAAPASAAADHWTYHPPVSGSRGTMSWTDSSGFENVMNGVVLSSGLITFSTGYNADNANLKNLDLSIPVYAEDGTTQYAFSPSALGDGNSTGRLVSGAHLTNIVLHAGCKSVGRYCFKACTGLVRIFLNDGLEDVCEEAFSGCTALATIDNCLPDTLKGIGKDGFYDCPVRGHVVVSSAFTFLGARAFRNARIESFTASKKGLRSIGSYAFSGCTLLTNIVLSADMETFEASWVKNTAAAGGGHVWFRNLPSNLPSNIWLDSNKQCLMIHLPWTLQSEWRAWVASGPSGHTFTFKNATKTLPDTMNGVGTWKASVTQNVTWWKDLDEPTLIIVK